MASYDLESKNGMLLLADDGVSLRPGGCCCEECALVTVSVGISSYYTQPGSGGDGSHGLLSDILMCHAVAEVYGKTLSKFLMAEQEESCSPSPPCGTAQATAKCYYGKSYAIVPFKRGSTRTNVANGRFASSKKNVGSAINYIKWKVEVKYESQSGGAPTAHTMKPLVEIVFTNGVTKSTNGSDATWDDAFRTEAYPGRTMGAVDWDIYFT